MVMVYIFIICFVICYIFFMKMSTSVRCEFIPTLCLKLSAGSLLYTDLPVVIKLLMLSQFVKED
jgi:hypothetical protein